MGYDEQHPPAHTPGAISERGPATPWNHEDYEFPPSVGPVIYLILFIKLNLYIYINNSFLYFIYYKFSKKNLNVATNNCL